MRRLICVVVSMGLAVLLALSFVHVANATVVVGPVFDPYSNANLFVVSRENWIQAESEAQGLGGNLITIHSSAENEFVVTTILQDFSGNGGPNLSAVPLWIGLYDPTGAAVGDGPGGTGSQHAANFVWADGESSTYRNWNTSEPNNALNDEYYTAFNWHFAQGLSGATPGTWNDIPVAGRLGDGGNTDGPYFGIVAIAVPEPSTFVLLAIAAIGLFAWRRRR